MPRKTKEPFEEKKDVVKKSTTAKKSNELSNGAKLAMDIFSKVKEVTSKATSKKSITKYNDDEKTNKVPRKSNTKTNTAKKSVSKSSQISNSKIIETRKNVTNKTSDKPSTSKRPSSKSPNSKIPTTRKKSTTKTASKKVKDDVSLVPSKAIPMEVEYYDLPYKYNETVVKVLYQNPTTLFVYWEISDNDIKNYREKYGENFFETTLPILKVYNDTMNYNFEIIINDFANSWYFKINDSKCHYHVELGRRPKYSNDFREDYIYITSSNTIESPNDRILFNTNEDNSVYFRNVKNNSNRKVKLPKLIEQLNLHNKNFEFPLIKDLPDLYKHIYDVENLFEFDTISNPSSRGNPSSGSLSSRFK